MWTFTTLLGVSGGRFQLSVTWYQACARPPVFSFKTPGR